MLGNSLAGLTFVSLVLHVGLFCLFRPVFNNHLDDSRLYSRGEAYRLGGMDLKEQAGRLLSDKKNDSSLEFFLSKADEGLPKSGKLETKTDITKYNIDPEAQEAVRPLENTYFFDVGKNAILPESSYLSHSPDKYLSDKYGRKEVKVSVLVSPSGRAVWVRNQAIFSEVNLRMKLDDWVRHLNFPARGIYYWKNIKIVLQ